MSDPGRSGMKDRILVIDGEPYIRCFAYRSKRDPSKFGLLEAAGYDDARAQLDITYPMRCDSTHPIKHGWKFRIKYAWAPRAVVVGGTSEEKLAVVESIFAGSFPRPPRIAADAEWKPTCVIAKVVAVPHEFARREMQRAWQRLDYATADAWADMLGEKRPSEHEAEGV